MLLEIKRGDWDLAAVKEHADEWFAKVRDTPTVLPTSIDEDAIDKVVVGMIGSFHEAAW
jgi:hypothetical protein